MATLTDNHRYFIQYMLKNGITTVENAQKYCKHISKGEIDNISHLKTLVIEINREISKQFYKLIFNKCEVTNQNCLVWLNTKNDDISKLQITYSAIELEYFHALLQEIIQSEEHRITFIVAINITSTLTSFLSRETGEKMIRKLINIGYFVNKGSYIYLGPRLILEFTSYLKSHVTDSICNLCSELVFWGKTCNSCHKILHSFCLNKYLENQNKCPNCQETWATIEDEEPSELNMDTDDDTPLSPIITSTRNTQESGSEKIQSQRRNESTRRIIVNEDTDDEDINQPGPSSRKRHR